MRTLFIMITLGVILDLLKVRILLNKDWWANQTFYKKKNKFDSIVYYAMWSFLWSFFVITPDILHRPLAIPYIVIILLNAFAYLAIECNSTNRGHEFSFTQGQIMHLIQIIIVFLMIE